MVFGSKLIGASYDILKSVNTTVWGGAQEVKKVETIVKTGLSAADVVVEVSHVLEDLFRDDSMCATIDIVGSVSSSMVLMLGNIPNTKHFTIVTGSITSGCRSVRYYCKNYGIFWGCTVNLVRLSSRL